MSSSYPEQRFLSRTKAGGLTPPIDGLLTPPRASTTPAQHTDNLSACTGARSRSAAKDSLTPRFDGLQGRKRSSAHTRHGTPRLHVHPAHTPHVTRASRGRTWSPPTRAYKTRPDQPVRARNVFGSGVRTLAVVRAVLTTIATLTTPLRHVILLGFVV